MKINPVLTRAVSSSKNAVNFKGYNVQTNPEAVEIGDTILTLKKAPGVKSKLLKSIITDKSIGPVIIPSQHQATKQNRVFLGVGEIAEGVTSYIAFDPGKTVEDQMKNLTGGRTVVRPSSRENREYLEQRLAMENTANNMSRKPKAVIGADEPSAFPASRLFGGASAPNYVLLSSEQVRNMLPAKDDAALS